MMDSLKSTDLGMLPGDWEVDQIGSLDPFVTSGSRGWARYYADSGAPFVRITNLSRESIYLDLADLKLVNLPSEDREGLRTQLQPGDLLVSITADIGIIGYVDTRVSQPAYINQHIALVRCEPSVADTKFLAYFLASEYPQRAFRAATDQGAKAGMNLAGVRRIKAARPPLPEQRAIATALSDVDALLGGLDLLINKKWDLKRVAMQQLLTGRTRLQGFHGEWGLQSLRCHVRLISGHHVLAQYCNSASQGVPYLTGPADFPHGCIRQTKFTTRPGSMCEPEDILVTVKGSGAGTVVLADASYCISRQLMAIRVDDWVPRFVYYSLLQNAEKFRAASTGLIPGLSRGDILDQLLPLPPTLAEQTTIAEVLRDMDADVAALEARRDKTRDLKRAMMQELLTGRTRLAPTGTDHA